MLARQKHTTTLLVILAALLVTILLATTAGAQLVLDDPLQGGTSGVRSGGAFANGGWQVTGSEDYIFWHLPYPVHYGAAEFYVKGVNPNQPEKNEHFHMYDYTWYNSDYSYAPGYRDNPYKMFIRKSGVNDGTKANSCEIVYQNTIEGFESDSAVMGWDPAANYKIRAEWGPEGGNTRLSLYRDGGLFFTQAIVGDYTPAGHSVRLAKARGAGEGAQPGAVYSYLKVWDLTNNIPGTPTITSPANGSTQKSGLVYVKWNGDSHTQYQVRACTSNDPNTGIVWDSGQISSARGFAWTGTLGNLTNYYLFVRLASSSGWGNWSANGYWVRVDNSYSGSNDVLVQGNSLKDNSGPFLGLGFTYMRSLQRCKYDRGRFQSDIANMASKGFKYQRILSMVDWAGLEIAPVSFGSIPAWPDYWAQFDYDIDYAYDNYGIRTEVTIFAGAQTVMPNDSTRYAHMDTILAHCNARSNKVVQIEVVNEGWQNGFPDESVTRTFCQYLADRTSIPVSITCPADRSAPSIQTMYGSGPADIATVHFSRDLGTSEGHWQPVRDPWYVADLYPSVPPVSSNEPIGSGSSVATEDHANHLCAAACFAWIANLPMYVYHSRAGTSAIDPNTGQDVNFVNTAGYSAYQYLASIIPPDVASWIRNDGKEAAAPFTVYCNGVANAYWTDIGGATSGCHRNIGARKGAEFICFTQGVLGGGVTLQARQQITFKVYDPMTGNVVMDTTTKNAGEQFTLSQGNEIYLIKGGYGASLPGQNSKTLNSKGPRTLTIDGNSSDWNLAEYTTKVRGGQTGQGDTALTGFDGATCYYGSYAPGTVLPTSASDHTAKIYSRNDGTYLYILARCDDSDMRYNNAVGSNWLNDCVEFYIDPAHDGGASPISNSSSDIQLVIDANNQKNVYMCTSGYATQILNGLTSAVVRDGSGWWLEARIAKSALDPDVPTFGNTVGLDFNFRDNDNNNDVALTSVYSWNDSSYQGFPSKIPNNWGDLFLDNYQTPYSGVISIPGTIEAENYDIGGENISYHDTSGGNTGGLLRTDDVDVADTTDTGGGYCIGWVDPGEWLEYTINVASSGDYTMKARVANGSGGNGTFRILIDGTDVTGPRTLAPNGGWQTWTSIFMPARYMSAGQHVLRFLSDSGNLNLNYIQIDSNGADAVSMDLGSPDIEDGMTHIQVADGDTIPWTVAGHICRENVDYPDTFMYFGVTDIYAYQGSKPNIAVTLDYFDIGTATLGIDYDSTSSAYTPIPGPTMTNSLTWKSYTFNLSNVYFGNRQNGGADFRFWVNSQQEWAVDSVCVYVGSTDTTPPANVTGFTATVVATGGQINLAWTNPGSDFTGTKIMFKTTGYPTSASDGTSIYDSNGTSFNHTSLTNGVTYYYKAFAHDAIPNYASGAQASGVPADTTPPSNVTGLTATVVATGGQINLAWTNPGSDFTGTKILFKTTGYPTSASDGTSIYDSSGTSFNHTSLTNGITYYYKAFAHDATPNYASGAQVSGVPADTTPPANVTSFTATPGSGQNALSWVNPGSDFTGTKIVFKTTGYPTSTADGTSIYDSNGTSYTHLGLTAGVTYYYKAFAHDAAPNYASGAQASGVPTGDVTAPTFGGSISPSVTNSLTPTITITAQDTGSGLNVSSAEFAYSVDGGTSFGTYIGRYTLHSTGTGSGGANRYWYPDFYHPASYTIAAGDHLQYDIYGNNTDGTGAVDLEGSFGNLRDSGILDQNGLSGHSGTNLYSRDYHQWYHRDFDLSSKAGQTITAYEMAHETDTGVSDFRVRNVIITNNGLVKDRAANADAWVSVSDTIGPGTSGYGTLVGPEMLANDPVSPAACTGTNGTTAVQNVTAAFSTRMTPLVVGGNNRIKYHISDMNANRQVTGVFAITVDQTAPSCTIGTPSPTTVAPGASFTYPVTYADNVGLGTINLTTAKVHVTTVSGTASATVSSITNGTTATPTVNLTNATGSGTLRIYIDAGGATDTAGNTDAGATAGTNVTVSGSTTISNSSFDSDANGWTTTYWKNGTIDGVMAWNSGAGRTGGGMRFIGAGASDNNDKCTREGAELQKTISTAGYSNIRVLYDLRVNTLGGDWTGAGIGGSCPVDHALIDDQITVYYSTNGGSSWTEAEYILRGTLLSTYQTYGTRTIDLTGVPAVNNNANFRLRLRWQVNGTNDQCDLDNIKVTSN